MKSKITEQFTTPAMVGFIILATLIVLSGCNLNSTEEPPTPTITVTQTESPTPTIDWFPVTATPNIPVFSTPTPQPTMEDTRIGITELLIDDDFSNDSFWEVRQSASGNIAFGTNNLTIAIAKPSTSLMSVSKHQTPEDFYLELTYQTSICQPEDQIGIIFLRQNENEYYRLLSDCSGRIRLEIIKSGQSSVLQNWETGQCIQPGAPATNRVGLWVFRGQLQLYINDAFQFSQKVVSSSRGSLGVFARTINEGPLTVRFSDLQVYRVESE